MRLADLPPSLVGGFHQLSCDGEQVFGNDSVGDARECVHRQEAAVIGLDETSGDKPPFAGLEPDVHQPSAGVRNDADGGGNMLEAGLAMMLLFLSCERYGQARCGRANSPSGRLAL